MKKIIVFGATGATGREVVKQALEKGYEVTAVIRNPAAFSLQHRQLKIVEGDVYKPASFEKELFDKAAVISCLGNGTSTKATTIYSEGTQNILSAMYHAGVNRLICISAGALYINNQMSFMIRILTKLVLQNILKGPYADMRLMEAIVEKSNVDWTIVRPPMLKNKPLTGKYRIAVNANIKQPFSISRADLAQFMLNSIEDSGTFKAKVEIAY